MSKRAFDELCLDANMWRHSVMTPGAQFHRDNVAYQNNFLSLGGGGGSQHGFKLAFTLSGLYRPCDWQLLIQNFQKENGFPWLPAKLLYKMYAFWLLVCIILLSKNTCLIAKILA